MSASSTGDGQRTPHPADRELVAAVLRGQSAAVREFMDRMHCVPRMLTNRNVRRGRPFSDDELEDVIQETLISIWKKLDRYDGRAALETWTFRFCFLEFLRRLRDKERRPPVLEQPLERVSAEADSEPPITDLDLERVMGALDELDAGLATLLRLKHFENLTFEAIGARLGEPTNTIKTRYYRGLRKLRLRLGKPMGRQIV